MEKSLPKREQEKYSDFFASLHIVKELTEQSELRIAAQLAPDFNYFDLFDPNENALSFILADLLDPEGWHGQGSEFLRLFCESIGVDFSTSVLKASVETESSTYLLKGKERRRIDLVIETKDWIVGIENKPWASDQKDQLLDYYEHLKKVSGGKKKYALVYLSGYGNVPVDLDVKQIKNHSFNNGTLIMMRYSGHGFSREAKEKEIEINEYVVSSDLVTWLGNCRQICAAQHVNMFLEHFIDYIKKKFSENEEGNMTELEKNVISFIRGSNSAADEERVKLAMSINPTALRNDITNGFISKLHDSFLDKYKATRNNIIECDDTLVGELSNGGWPKLQFFLPDWPQKDGEPLMSLVLETHGKALSKEVLYWGALCHESSISTEHRESLIKSIENKLGCPAGKSEEWWPWWTKEKWCNYKDDDILVTLMDLESEQVKEYIEDTVGKWILMVDTIDEFVENNNWG